MTSKRKDAPKNPAAVALGKLGGKAAAKVMTEAQRKERARKGGKTRAANAKKRKEGKNG